MTRAYTSVALLACVLCAVSVQTAARVVGDDGAAVRFTDVTEAVGVQFTHNSGAYGEKLLPETMGSGLALFDADGDGDLDLLLLNGKDWPGRRTGKSSVPALYLWSSGQYHDRTADSGLDQPMYAMGVAVGDYDNDGDSDLYVTCLGPDRLFRNEGGARFVEVSGQSGIRNHAFGAGAAWFDYDRDGYLDLYVCNYVDWSIETDIFCTVDGVTKAYCTPESYAGVADKLYRNNGNGTFSDDTERAGVYDPTSKSLGVVTFDYNGDGWDDVFVTNDTQPDKLYENRGDGMFEEIGMLAGVAFDENGIAKAGMGVDAADFDGSGRIGIVVGNFSNQMLSLYRNEGHGLFIDAASNVRIGGASFLTLHFGCFFFDVDGDGWQDIFVANGHVEDTIGRVQEGVTYAQAPHLFLNAGKGERFTDVAPEAGLTEALVGRGAVYGDIDGDGDLDVVVSTNGSAARVFRNDTVGGNRVRFRLVGRDANRDAVGAIVTVHNGATQQQQVVKGGGSYCSQSERTLTFGLDRATVASRVDVLFPSGRLESFRDVAVGQTVEISEREGITSSKPFASTDTGANGS